MDENKIIGSITIKPSQLGILIDENYCLKNFIKILKRAKLIKKFVWLDMGDYRVKHGTIRVYTELLEKFSGLVGLCIQSTLKESKYDLVKLLKNKAIIRLVKGAYKESPQIAFIAKKDVDNNFANLMQILFERGKYFAIATHDDELIYKAVRMNEKYKRRIEFQMLMGIRGELKGEIAKFGYNVVEYVPYGKEWVAFCIRRLMEKKSNIFLILRSLIQQ